MTIEEINCTENSYWTNELSDFKEENQEICFVINSGQSIFLENNTIYVKVFDERNMSEGYNKEEDGAIVFTLDFFLDWYSPVTEK